MIPDVTLYDKTFEVYIPKKRIEATVLDLVDHVAHDLGEAACPIFVGVLNGAFLFMSDFVRHYPYNCELSFVKMASYRGTSTTGHVQTLLGVNEDFSGRTVVVLEDIVDTGNTIERLYELFRESGVGFSDRYPVLQARFVQERSSDPLSGDGRRKQVYRRIRAGLQRLGPESAAYLPIEGITQPNQRSTT